MERLTQQLEDAQGDRDHNSGRENQININDVHEMDNLRQQLRDVEEQAEQDIQHLNAQLEEQQDNFHDKTRKLEDKIRALEREKQQLKQAAAAPPGGSDLEKAQKDQIMELGQQIATLQMKLNRAEASAAAGEGGA